MASSSRKKKIKLIDIKRENINTKYFVVLRENNKIIEKIRWSNSPTRKDNKINVKEGKTIYKQNKSLFENRRRVTDKTWKTIEETRFDQVQGNRKSDKAPKLKIIKNLKYRYYIKGFLIRSKTNQVEVVASSQAHHDDYPVEKARNEAWESFYERVHHAANNFKDGHYDANEGLKIVEQDRVRIIDEGIIQYRIK